MINCILANSHKTYHTIQVNEALAAPADSEIFLDLSANTHKTNNTIQVNEALAAPADSDIKIEDLDGLLASMKQMFIDKQKMVDGLNATPS